MKQHILEFEKYHGLGNDYIFLDEIGNPPLPEAVLPELARRMSRRKFGVGADGIVLVQPSVQADARMRIFNADGSEAETCGNALRCIARILYEKGYVSRKDMVIETGAGMVDAHIFLDGKTLTGVRINMGTPRWDRKSIPVTGDGDARNIRIPLPGETLTATCLSVGNPHCVIITPQLDTAIVKRIGPLIERHPLFPHRINAGFAEIVNPRKVRAAVWERGAGLTLACGSGATAIFAALHDAGKLDSKATIEMPGGALELETAGGGDILMTGPAEFVFSGKYTFNTSRPDDAEHA